MYIPSYFKIEDKEKMYDIIEEHGFATIFSQHNGEPYATHLPLTLNREEGILYGHFARPNGQWKDISDQTVLVTFQGPHCYISSSWYETDKAVPTWNFVAVHVYGKVEIVDDEQEIYDSLRKMVTKYEQPTGLYNLDEVDANYIDGLSKGIVGFKINIKKMEGKAKLSQNHSAERKQLVIEQLGQRPHEDEQQIARLMRAEMKE